MRCAEKDDTVGRHEYGAEALVFGSAYIIGIQKCSLGQNPSETVADPDDRIPHGLLVISVRCEEGDQGLSVVVDEIVARAVHVLAE